MERGTKVSCKKSILAGMLIGIGGTAYLCSASKELGALLFAVGLLAVIAFECSLYTGKVGYMSRPAEILKLVIICGRNFIGSAIIGALAYSMIGEQAAAVTTAKLAQPMLLVFEKAILCGALIYLAVELYRRTENIWLVVLPIMIFVVCGFEHCVANVFYFTAGGLFDHGVLDVYMILYIAVCIIGNAIGSLAVKFMQQLGW